MPEPTFDKVGDNFKGTYDSLRYYVREHLTRLHLSSCLPQGESLRAADVGGGSGRDSVWLAEQGYEVHLIDPSSEMLEDARVAKEAQPASIGDRIHIRQGNVFDLVDDLAGSFDLVVSHAVVMYDLDSPWRHVQALFDLLKPKGRLSFLTKGQVGALNRLLYNKDFEGLPELVDSGQTINRLGERVWAFNEKQIKAMINIAGGRILRWFGVRVFTDHREDNVNDYAPEQLQQILELEKEVGANPTTRGMGQLLHFIAEKDPYFTLR